jgi:hypothetical protein
MFFINTYHQSTIDVSFDETKKKLYLLIVVIYFNKNEYTKNIE